MRIGGVEMLAERLSEVEVQRKKGAYPSRIGIPLNDLKRRYDSIQPEIEVVVAQVMASGWYVLGPQVEAFEREFAAYTGTADCVGVANGTDALEIALRVIGVAHGEEVITVANAGMFSTSAIRSIGAVPVFAEIDPNTLTLNPAAAEHAISTRTRAMIVTHLYGRMAHMPALRELADRHALALIEDCAQAHGARSEGIMAGAWGDIGCFSFYPTKNLGALGDAGAIVTRGRQYAERARLLRQYGWTRKYEAHLPGGRNSRLDELQAAVLRAQLPYLEVWNQARQAIGDRYTRGLAGTGLRLPEMGRPGEMVYHLYVVRSSSQRDLLRAGLLKRRIGCEVHFPTPDYLQPACATLGYMSGALPITEQAAREVLSIPCFPELTSAEVDQVCEAIKEVINGGCR